MAFCKDCGRDLIWGFKRDLGHINGGLWLPMEHRFKLQLQWDQRAVEDDAVLEFEEAFEHHCGENYQARLERIRKRNEEMYYRELVQTNKRYK